MAGTVLFPLRISRVGGGRLKNCRFGFEELLDGDDTLDSGDPPEVTTDVDGLAAENVAICAVAVEIGGVEFGTGQSITFDLVAAADADLGDGLVQIRAYSEAGMELEYEKDVTVYERLPSR